MCDVGRGCVIEISHLLRVDAGVWACLRGRFPGARPVPNPGELLSRVGVWGRCQRRSRASGCARRYVRIQLRRSLGSAGMVGEAADSHAVLNKEAKQTAGLVALLALASANSEKLSLQLLDILCKVRENGQLSALVAKCPNSQDRRSVVLQPW
ncbi:hypothetical protein NDU88_003159 [Pleurodeles waltl]|uniref:Uncharacterized protein n=1 Tax=Pleurodeles waltl TaxID=8319 RepID=A0AAV7P994_PLEWA|nr:hypothetical protein NDU88_003159 [Pleurodeles waltl]